MLDGEAVSDPMSLMGHRREAWQKLWCRQPFDSPFWVSGLVFLRTGAAEQALTPLRVTWRGQWSGGRRQSPLDGTKVGPSLSSNSSTTMRLTDSQPRSRASTPVWPCRSGPVWPLRGFSPSPPPPPGRGPYVCKTSTRYGGHSSFAGSGLGRQVRHWNDAVQGSCAQSAGTLRSLLDELAADSGIDTCSVYLDLAKLYDNISLGKLLQ